MPTSRSIDTHASQVQYKVLKHIFLISWNGFHTLCCGEQPPESSSHDSEYFALPRSVEDKGPRLVLGEKADGFFLLLVRQ